MILKASPKQKIALICSSVILGLVILEIGLRIGGFVFFSAQEYKNRLAIRNKGAYRILCLGESTTAMGGENSWPAQLEKILNKRNMGIKFSVINKGLPGGYTSDIVLNLEDNLNKYSPKMVITMMGINDFGEIVPYKDISSKGISPFLKTLRIYKLAKILYLHIRDKVKTTQYFKSDKVEYKNGLGKGNLVLTNIQKDNFKEQEKILKEIRANFAGQDWKRIEQGWYFRDQNDWQKAEAMFEKAIEINPENYSAYHDLGMLYKAKRDYDKAEQMFKKTLEINPGYDWSYIELGWCYAILKNWQKAEGMFKKAIEINSKSDRAYGGLFLCYEVQKKHALANGLLKELNALRLEKYNPITRYNYQKLREIVIQRRIKLVCVQYPVRSIQQFKKMLEPYGDIIFVDNEKIFKEALKQGSYDEYFEDSFGGDFGHCTKKGNELLADNIACVIKENLFNRWP